jgi:N-acyl amino acid synthase FeeM
MGLMERFKQASRAWAATIVAFQPTYLLREPGLKDVGVLPQRRSGAAAVEKTREGAFKVRLAHSQERSKEANVLVKRRYSAAGYVVVGPGAHQVCPDEITLMSYSGDKVVGTLTLGMDIGNGLYADELYKAEVDGLRAGGRKVAEITKLAIDSKHASKRVFASLIHIAHIFLRNLWRYTDVVIEVNPSHVHFYKKMLGFKDLGPERHCPRVDAPAVLLWVELSYLQERIEEVGGRKELAKQDKSLYPYFFSKAEEAGITRRLMQKEYRP